MKYGFEFNLNQVLLIIKGLKKLSIEEAGDFLNTFMDACQRMEKEAAARNAKEKVPLTKKPEIKKRED